MTVMLGTVLFACAGFIMLLCGLLHADPLAPGATIPLSGTTFAADNELGGSIKWDETTPFEIRNASGNVFISGNLKDSVTESSLTGLLIFNRAIRAVSAPSGTARIVGVSSTHFGGLDISAEYRTDGLGSIGPVSSSRSGGTGDVVSFDFTGAGLADSEESRTCFAKTDANGFGLGATVTISAVESPGGPVFSVVIENATKPQVLPTDRVVVTSVEQTSFSYITIEWLSITAKDYEVYKAPSPAGPWTYAGNGVGSVNPRSLDVFISGGVKNQPYYFFRVDELP